MHNHGQMLRQALFHQVEALKTACLCAFADIFPGWSPCSFALRRAMSQNAARLAAANTPFFSALLHQIPENSDLARPGSVVEKASQSRNLGLFFGLRQCVHDLQGVQWGSAP